MSYYRHPVPGSHDWTIGYLMDRTGSAQYVRRLSPHLVDEGTGEEWFYGKTAAGRTYRLWRRAPTYVQTHFEQENPEEDHPQERSVEGRDEGVTGVGERVTARGVGARGRAPVTRSVSTASSQNTYYMPQTTHLHLSTPKSVRNAQKYNTDSKNTTSSVESSSTAVDTSMSSTTTGSASEEEETTEQETQNGTSAGEPPFPEVVIHNVPCDTSSVGTNSTTTGSASEEEETGEQETNPNGTPGETILPEVIMQNVPCDTSLSVIKYFLNKHTRKEVDARPRVHLGPDPAGRPAYKLVRVIFETIVPEVDGENDEHDGEDEDDDDEKENEKENERDAYYRPGVDFLDGGAAEDAATAAAKLLRAQPPPSITGPDEQLALRYAPAYRAHLDELIEGARRAWGEGLAQDKEEGTVEATPGHVHVYEDEDENEGPSWSGGLDAGWRTRVEKQPMDKPGNNNKSEKEDARRAGERRYRDLLRLLWLQAE